MVERVCEMADAFLRHLQKIAAASQDAAKLAVVCIHHLQYCQRSKMLALSSDKNTR